MSIRSPGLRGFAPALGLTVLLAFAAPCAADAPAAPPPESASLPTHIQNKPPLADTWRAIRQGDSGTVNNFPNDLRGRLIQSEGEAWRSLRNGWVIPGAAIALVAVLVALGLFYAVRGKIRLDHPETGRLILRFTTIERFGHWLTAGSFLWLALTGLNMLFGRYALEPLIGKDAFAAVTRVGKWTHNMVGFLFIAGLFLIFSLWARDNLWDRYDWGWIKNGGGLLKKGVHPPAARFNFGEKSQFWMVILVGALVAFTGLNLLFPLALTGLLGMQVMQLLHAAAAVGMLMAIFGHIYIGTVGSEGASRAMTTGFVDEAWARQHHSVWVEEVRAKEGEAPPGARGQPAE